MKASEKREQSEEERERGNMVQKNEMSVRNRRRGDREKVKKMYSVSGRRKECDK